MTNPQTYFRDAEQLETEMFGGGRSEGRQSRISTRNRVTAWDCRYSKETLPSGCILYSMKVEIITNTQQSAPVQERARTPATLLTLTDSAGASLAACERGS